jgi:PII-like signaling protein
MQAPGPAVLVRIYTEEGKQNGGRPLYEAIVMKARELGLAGATVLRGPMGYGHSHKLHTAKILDLSAKLPLVIEIVDTEDKVQTLLAALGDMRDIGLVTTEMVQVVHYG